MIFTKKKLNRSLYYIINFENTFHNNVLVVTNCEVCDYHNKLTFRNSQHENNTKGNLIIQNQHCRTASIATPHSILLQ